jgi:hypothetical protein
VLYVCVVHILQWLEKTAYCGALQFVNFIKYYVGEIGITGVGYPCLIGDKHLYDISGYLEGKNKIEHPRVDNRKILKLNLPLPKMGCEHVDFLLRIEIIFVLHKIRRISAQVSDC